MQRQYDPEIIAIIEELAQEASLYANVHIKEGTTQLVNNNYSIEKVNSLYSGVEDLRAAVDSYQESLDRLEQNKDIAKFTNFSELSKKLSLGNCWEMAALALEYIHYALTKKEQDIQKQLDALSDLKETQRQEYTKLKETLHKLEIAKTLHINASVFNIKNGNHVFLVVGIGNITNSKNWDDATFISDPWSKKVYKAIDYPKQLQNFNFYFDRWENRYINQLEPLKPYHRLEPYFQYNLRSLQLRESSLYKNELRFVFNKKIDIILDAMHNLNIALVKIQHRLKKEYGIENSKYKIITAKIEALATSATNIRNFKLASIDEEQSYQQIEQGLRAQLNKAIDASRTLCEFTPQEVSDLNQYQKKKREAVLKFFGVAPTTKTKTKEALQTFNDVVIGKLSRHQH